MSVGIYYWGRLFMYNKDKTTLYFSGYNKDFYLLGLHLSNPNIKSFIDSDLFYLAFARLA